jgi:hypothetical protein
MAIDYKALAAKAVASGVDMTKASKGGSDDYVPPAAGPTRVRFISYIEVGKHKESYLGKPKIENQAYLTFELSGPKHPPTVTESGERIPHRISFKVSVSLNEKANFYKLFQKLNHAGKARHIAELLGEAYKATVVHRKYAKKGEDKAAPATWTGIAAELSIKGSGFTFEPARYELVDPETGPTGEFALLKVDPPISPIKCFLWDYADKEQWDSVFIDGEYPARTDEKTGVITAPAKSKNQFQNLIKLAENFKGSVIHGVLAAGGAVIDIPDAESGRDGAEEADETAAVNDAAPAVPTGAAADDALNGIV